MRLPPPFGSSLAERLNAGGDSATRVRVPGKTWGHVMLEKQNAARIAGPLSALVRQAGSRLRTRATNLVTAAEACGPIEPGMIATGITKGSFSMLDLIEHVLSTTGPAEVDVSTWTMGIYDADVLWNFVDNGGVQRIRFLLDPSMFRVSQSRYAPAFLAAFGGDAIRAVENHAKFTLVGNAEWQITICASMNLNRNKRLENFCLFEGRAAYDFYRAIVDDVFAQVKPIADHKRISRSDFETLDLESDHGRSAGHDGDDGADSRHQRAASRAPVEVW